MSIIQGLMVVFARDGAENFREKSRLDVLKYCRTPCEEQHRVLDNLVATALD